MKSTQKNSGFNSHLMFFSVYLMVVVCCREFDISSSTRPVRRDIHKVSDTHMGARVWLWPGVTSRHARRCCRKEVVCDTSRKLVASAMHCKTTRPQAPRGCGWTTAICCTACSLLSTLETEERNESYESEILGNPFLWFLALAGWGRVFLSRSAKPVVAHGDDMWRSRNTSCRMNVE